MEHWEKQLVAELKAGQYASLADPSAPAAPTADPLRAAFERFVAGVEARIERVRHGADVDVLTTPASEEPRREWIFGGRTLRLRLEPEAGKFFVSVEGETGLELDELWLEDGVLVVGAGGAPRPADLPQLHRRCVTLLFRGFHSG
jgi:hypothetical protein